jgi:hypothetical protein
MAAVVWREVGGTLNSGAERVRILGHNDYDLCSSVSRATRSCGSFILFIRYWNSPPFSGSCMMTS